MDFGFSFDAVPTIDTVLYIRRSTKEDRGDLKTQVQVEQAESIFELQRQDIHEWNLY